MTEVLRASDPAALTDALAPRGPSAVAIGVFDGVHLGHRRIAEETVRAASQLGVHSEILTFCPAPGAVLTPGFRYLTSLEDRLDLLCATGVDVVRLVPFVPTFQAIPAEVYVREILAGALQAKTVIVGPTHRFGARGAGDLELLSRLGGELGFSVRVVPHLLLDGAPISSSRVRSEVSEGRVETALRMLGRPHSLEGAVATGTGRGRTIGVPTANLALPTMRVIPAEGIYASLAVTENGDVFPAATHVGPVPTFEREEPILETHLVGYSGDLVGTRLRVEFLERLRGIERFSGPDALVARIRQDIAETTRIAERRLASNPESLRKGRGPGC